MFLQKNNNSGNISFRCVYIVLYVSALYFITLFSRIQYKFVSH